MVGKHLHHFIGFVLIGGLWWSANLLGQEPSDHGRGAATEYGVKAAFLLNFTKFVEWPSAATRRKANDPFLVCILGVTPFGPALDAIFNGETVAGRLIAVKRLDNLNEYCEVLFVAASERNQAEILRQAGPGTLTVGESPTFLRDGGIIRFVVEDRRVRFDVNRGSAERASLRISSRLLGVARSSVK